MPIAYDGQVYEDEYSLAAGRPVERADTEGKTHITVTPPTTPSTMPLGSPEKPADALNPEEGTPLPTQNLISPEPSQSLTPDYVNPPEGSIIPKIASGLEHVAKSVWDAMLLPGNVLQGKVPVWAVDPETGEVSTSPQVLEKTLDLAGLMVMGPAPVASKMAEGTLGSFAGVKSKTLDKGALEVAQAAEKQGISNTEIWQKTGFFKGADGRWRHEIDDSGLKYTPEKLSSGTSVSLPEVLDHPELYKAYPLLKDTKIRYEPMYKGAAYYEGGNYIVVGKAYKDRPDVIMHEVQHAIQGIEGFAKGGTPGKVGKDYQLKYEEALNDVRKEFHTLWKKQHDQGFLSAEEAAKMDYMSFLFRKYSEYAKAGDNKAVENYMRLAGEVEARNAQNRMSLTPEQRFKNDPKLSQDVDDINQIVSPEAVLTTPYTSQNSR